MGTGKRPDATGKIVADVASGQKVQDGADINSDDGAIGKRPDSPRPQKLVAADVQSRLNAEEKPGCPVTRLFLVGSREKLFHGAYGNAPIIDSETNYAVFADGHILPL